MRIVFALLLLCLSTPGYAQVSLLVEEIKYPDGIFSTGEKMEFLYRTYEKLRLEHNEMGAKWKDKKITDLEWEEYQKKDFKPRHDKIINDIVKAKDALKQSTKHDLKVDLNDLEK